MTEPIEKIIEAFWGYKLYFVGGYVRDSIMNIESHDIDFATNSTPSGMITTCKSYGLNFRYTKNSIAHGTITIEGFEITSFRKDISCDGRNSIIEFAETIEEDLSRRDLTCNSMAIDCYTSEIVDPFNGIQDIKNKIIRAVGNPRDRLNEDTLRALRAIRFANRFGFEIEYNLFRAIIDTNISNLSVERVREEFMKILETRNSKYLGIILLKVIPEFEVLNNLYGGDRHAETVDQHSIMTMQHTIKVSDNPLKIFVALLHDIGKGYTVYEERLFHNHEGIGAKKIKEIMLRLKFSSEEIEYSQVIVENHMRWHFYGNNEKAPTDKAIRNAIRDLPDKFNKEDMVKDLIILTWADTQANLLNKPESFEDYTERKEIYKRSLEIIHKKPEVKAGHGLELSGKDLIEMKYVPGVIFNIIIKDVEKQIFNEKLINDKEAIRKYIEENYQR